MDYISKMREVIKVWELLDKVYGDYWITKELLPSKHFSNLEEKLGCEEPSIIARVKTIAAMLKITSIYKGLEITPYDVTSEKVIDEISEGKFIKLKEDIIYLVVDSLSFMEECEDEGIIGTTDKRRFYSLIDDIYSDAVPLEKILRYLAINLVGYLNLQEKSGVDNHKETLDFLLMKENDIL